jgi:hypothetical protein
MKGDTPWIQVCDILGTWSKYIKDILQAEKPHVLGFLVLSDRWGRGRLAQANNISEV